MEEKYKGANIAPMMRAFDDRGKGGIITLEEFEDEVAGGFGKVSTRLLAGESRVVSARFFGDAPDAHLLSSHMDLFTKL